MDKVYIDPVKKTIQYDNSGNDDLIEIPETEEEIKKIPSNEIIERIKNKLVSLIEK